MFSNTNWYGYAIGYTGEGGTKVSRVEEYKDLSRGSRHCLMHLDSNKDSTVLQQGRTLSQARKLNSDFTCKHKLDSGGRLKYSDETYNDVITVLG